MFEFINWWIQQYLQIKKNSLWSMNVIFGGPKDSWLSFQRHIITNFLWNGIQKILGSAESFSKKHWRSRLKLSVLRTINNLSLVYILHPYSHLRNFTKCSVYFRNIVMRMFLFIKLPILQFFFVMIFHITELNQIRYSSLNT